MLERQTLLIQPWTRGPSCSSGDESGSFRPGRIRPIQDPDSDQALGFACAPAAEARWWCRFNQPALAVHETEDQSLLFTAHRLWALASKWQVRDAEGRRLGVCRPCTRQLERTAVKFFGLSAPCPKHIDRYGPGLAEQRYSTNALVIQGRADNTAAENQVFVLSELVTFARSGQATRLTFASDCVDDPLAKMVVLAAVLIALE